MISSGAFFKCSSMRVLIYFKHSPQKGFGNFFDQNVKSAVPTAAKSSSKLNPISFRFDSSICFHGALLFAALLNHENLKELQLDRMSGKSNPPLLSGCFASTLATFSLPFHINAYISDSKDFNFAFEIEGIENAR